MIDALFDRLHKQAQIRADKTISTELAKLEKQKKYITDSKDGIVKELLTKALKQLLIDKTITKPEAQLMVKKYGLSPIPKPIKTDISGGCGAMAPAGTRSGNRC